jgi:hypothetical protein
MVRPTNSLSDGASGRRDGALLGLLELLGFILKSGTDNDGNRSRNNILAANGIPQ